MLLSCDGSSDASAGPSFFFFGSRYEVRLPLVCLFLFPPSLPHPKTTRRPTHPPAPCTQAQRKECETTIQKRADGGTKTAATTTTWNDTDDTRRRCPCGADHFRLPKSSIRLVVHHPLFSFFSMFARALYYTTSSAFSWTRHLRACLCVFFSRSPFASLFRFASRKQIAEMIPSLEKTRTLPINVSSAWTRR